MPQSNNHNSWPGSKTVVVPGATGLIGGALCTELGDHVVALTRDRDAARR